MKKTCKSIVKYPIRIALAFSMLFLVAEKLGAAHIRVFHDTDVPLNHYAETTMAYGESDSLFLDAPSPAIDGYLLKGQTKLQKQSKDSNDFSNFYGQLKTTGIQVGQPAWWNAEVDNSDGALDDKNVIVKVYDENADVNNPDATTITIFDPLYESTHNPDYYGWFQSGSFDLQTSGIYGQIVYDIKNHADLNRDRKVDFKDYAIFAGKWGTTGIDKGSDPTALGDYADIDGNGTVDVNDLAAFCEDWLKDINDPSTW